MAPERPPRPRGGVCEASFVRGAGPPVWGASERGVEIAKASGIISSRRAAKISSARCHPNTSIRLTPSGENRNWPNEPAAVPAPKASERQLSGRSLPNEEITRLNEQPERPKPISAPDER